MGTYEKFGTKVGKGFYLKNVALLCAITFATELLIILGFSLAGDDPISLHLGHALIDSVVLLGVFLVSSYYLVFRPLLRHIAERAEGEKSLQREIETLEDFASGVAHDIRSPLRSINKLALWLKEEREHEEFSETTLELLELLEVRAQKVVTVVDDIIDYAMTSRPESVEEVKLLELVNETREFLSASYEFNLVTNGELPTLIGGQTTLLRIVMNLVENAAKHYEGADVCRVEVAATQVGDFYEIAVADNGPGIDEKFHDKVWELFEKLKSDDALIGSGLGLSAVKKAVENAGGRVWLQSIPGQGSTFLFSWPVDGPSELVAKTGRVSHSDETDTEKPVRLQSNGEIADLFRRTS